MNLEHAKQRRFAKPHESWKLLSISKGGISWDGESHCDDGTTFTNEALSINKSHIASPYSPIIGIR